MCVWFARRARTRERELSLYLNCVLEMQFGGSRARVARICWFSSRGRARAVVLCFREFIIVDWAAATATAATAAVAVAAAVAAIGAVDECSSHVPNRKYHDSWRLVSRPSSLMSPLL